MKTHGKIKTFRTISSLFNPNILILRPNISFNFSSHKIKQKFDSKKSFSSTDHSSSFPDHWKYKIPEYKKNTDLDFPWLINGAPILQIKSRFLPDQVFARSSISRAELLSHLFKIYRGVLLASSQKDFSFIDEYVELTMATKLKSKLESFEKRGLIVDVVEDLRGLGNKPVPIEMHLYDSVIVKGLSTDRSKNDIEKHYSISNELDEMGLISYIHKEISDSSNFMTREQGANTLTRDNFNTIIFRAYVMFKSGIKLFVKDSKGEMLFKYSDDYNFNHACVFECEMEHLNPLKSYSKIETYTEWISKHGFGVWKLSDMDNWMKGNNYITLKN